MPGWSTCNDNHHIADDGKTNVAGIETNVADIETNVAGHRRAAKPSMGGDLSRLAGRDYESYAARRMTPDGPANLLDLLNVKTLIQRQ